MLKLWNILSKSLFLAKYNTQFQFISTWLYCSPKYCFKIGSSNDCIQYSVNGFNIIMQEKMLNIKDSEISIKFLNYKPEYKNVFFRKDYLQNGYFD